MPDNADWLAEFKTELAGVTNTEIKSLYIDLVDALAMCEQMDTSITYCVNPDANKSTTMPRRAIR
jgi:hypothetical protein